MSSTPVPPRTAHPYHMHDAIYAQPDALRLVTRPNSAALADAAQRLGGTERVWIAGIGSSWHAALVGELALAGPGGLGARVRAVHTFELTQYWPADDVRTGVVAVSHGGGSRYTADALGRAAGGVAVAITGRGAAPLRGADVTLGTVDQEASGVHTVSYTCALAMLIALASEVGARPDVTHALDALPDQVVFQLGQKSWEALADRFADRRRWLVVGGGPNVATAYEGALKLNEAARVVAEGVHCEQFLHGPWVAVGAQDVVIVVAPPGAARARCIDVARVARGNRATVVAIARADDRELAALADEMIALPECDELLSPIAAVVPLQLIAYHVAVRRGVDPDALPTSASPSA